MNVLLLAFSPVNPSSSLKYNLSLQLTPLDIHYGSSSHYRD